MLSLHTNAAALSAQSSIGVTQKSLSTSLTRLSTGYRVNSAMDDAAGLQIATRLNAQTRGMAVAQRNAQNGISMLQTAEGAFNEVTDILLRMKDLATEAATASATADDKASMQSEFDALDQELSNIIRNTSFGGENLFSAGGTAGTVAGDAGKMGDSAGMTFQIGASSAETMEVDFSTKLTAVGTALTSVSTNYVDAGATLGAGSELTGTGAAALIDTINGALDDVGSLRSALGAAANRLDHVYNNLANMSTNTQAAAGRIMDTNYAQESANMTAKQMQMQAGTAMLKQSSSMSQLVMSLLQ